MASTGHHALDHESSNLPSPISSDSRTFRGAYYFDGTSAFSGTVTPSTAPSFNAATPAPAIAPLVSLSGPPTYAHSLGVMIPSTPAGNPAPSVATQSFFLTLDGDKGEIDDFNGLFHKPNLAIPFTRKYPLALGAIANDWRLTEHKDVYNDLDRVPVRTSKPKIRDDVDGAEGIWDVMTFLIFSAKEHIAKSLVLGHFTTPSVLAEQVIHIASFNPTFQSLYRAHTASQLVIQMATMNSDALANPNSVVTPNIGTWNFSRGTMLQNPVSELLFVQLTHVTRENVTIGSAEFRYSIRHALHKHPLIGTPPMPSPDIKYSPAYIKQCANTILDKIYPTVWASYKMTQTEVDAVKDRALMSFYQSDVMDHAVSFAFTCHGLTEAAHGLIRTYGVGNIRHPNVFAVAAMAVETELRAAANSVDRNGTTESLWRRASVFPEVERTLYEEHESHWARFQKEGSPFKEACEALIKSKYDELDLEGVVRRAQAA